MNGAEQNDQNDPSPHSDNSTTFYFNAPSYLQIKQKFVGIGEDMPTTIILAGEPKSW